jgi:hypothetical protein
VNNLIKKPSHPLDAEAGRYFLHLKKKIASKKDMTVDGNWKQKTTIDGT